MYFSHFSQLIWRNFRDHVIFTVSQCELISRKSFQIVHSGFRFHHIVKKIRQNSTKITYEVITKCFHRKIVKMTNILLSGWHQIMASKIGINFFPLVGRKLKPNFDAIPLSRIQSISRKNSSNYILQY